MSDGKKATKAKTKRQIPAALLGLLLVFGAAIGTALWSTAQSERSPVLVAANDLTAGDVISAADLRVASVAVDPSVVTMSEASASSLVGATVLAPVASGSLLGPAMFGDAESLVPAGMALVGATLETGRYPSSGLRAGDQVILVHTTTDGPVRLGEAEVFAVTTLIDSLSGDLFVSLMVPEGGLVDATAGAAAAEDLSLASVSTEPDAATDGGS